MWGKELDLPFRHLLKSYRDQDPAPQPQLALPVGTVEHAGSYCTTPNTALTRATADLVTTTFFFLLRVGEYAMPRRSVRNGRSNSGFKTLLSTIRPELSSLLPAPWPSSSSLTQSRSISTIKRTANVAPPSCTHAVLPGSVRYERWPGALPACSRKGYPHLYP
jgi:hypothetical protein